MSGWWAEWRTYSPSDFLLFSPRTYYRLFELYNSDIWPLQIATLLAGIAILALVRSRIAWRSRAIAAILMACWLWVAWAFHWQRYATINWLAPYFTAGFALEAVLLFWIGVVRGRLNFDCGPDLRARTGFAMFLFGLLIQPLLSMLAGRTWMQLGIFGVAPDPTAVATLGLLQAGPRSRIVLLVPFIWCIVSAATLWTMGSAEAIVLLAAAAVTLLSLIRPAR